MMSEVNSRRPWYRRASFWLWLILNALLLASAAGLWAWAEYRYVTLYRPPEELRAYTQWIVFGLPAAGLVVNLWLLRRLSLWRHLVGSVLCAAALAGCWWLLFYTVGVRWHLALGGVLQ